MAPTAIDDEIDFQPAKQAAPPTAQGKLARDDEIDFKPTKSNLRTPSLDELSSAALPPTSAAKPNTPFPNTPFSLPRAPLKSNVLDIAGANPQNAVGGDLNATPVLTQEEQKRAGSISAQPDVTLPGPHGVPIHLTASDINSMGKTFLPGLNPDATLQGNAPIVDPNRGIVAPQNLLTEKQQQDHPILTGLGQLGEGLTSPENLAILAGTAGIGSLPAGARAALSTYFAAQMAKGATDYGVQGWEAYKRGDNKEAQRLWTLAAGSAVLGGAAGAHGIRESGILPGETDSVVPRGEVPKGTISAPLAKDAAVARAGRIMPEVEANAAARRGLPAVDQAVAAQRDAALNAPVNLPKLPETTEPTPILRGPAQGPQPNPLSKEAAEVRDQQSERAAKAPPEEQPVQVTDKRRVGAGGEQLIPEAFHTLQAQTDALDKGTNSVVYFPKGTDALPPPPEDATVTVVKGNKPGAGTYYHDDSLTPADIRKAVKNGTFGELLGHTQTKEEATGAGAPAVVVARTDGGTELKSSVVDGNNPEAVAEQKKTLQEQFPEAVIAQGKPEAVIAHRQGTQPAQAEKAPQTAVSGETPQNYKPSEKAATMSGTNTDRGPEFNAQQWQEEINRNNEILRNPKATDEERQIATDRLRDAKEGAANVTGQSKPLEVARGALSSHVADVEARFAKGEQIPMADVDRLHSLADTVENGGENVEAIRNTESSTGSPKEGEGRPASGTEGANRTDGTEVAATAKGERVGSTGRAEAASDEDTRAANPTSAKTETTESTTVPKAPETTRSVRPEVGDRVSITGSHKLSGQDAEVTKVEDAGVFVRQGDGPVKFVKNGEFEREPESDSAKPSASAATYTHPVAAILHQVGEWFRRDPASVKEQAKGNLREKLGENSRSMEQSIAALEKSREAWNGRSRQDALDFIDAIENGRTQNLSAGDRQMAQDLTSELNKARDDVRGLGVGALDHYIDDYFPHNWKQPGLARELFAQVASKKPLGGSKSFLKARTIPTTADGISYGLEPVTTNPVDMALLKISDMRKFILSEQMKKEAVGNGNVIMAENRRDLYNQLNQRAQANGAAAGSANSEDWVPIQKWNGKVGPNGTGDFKQAWAPRKFADVLNNYLEPGLRGNKAYDILRNASDKARFAQLGLSAFHLGSEAINSTVSSVALAFENLADTVKLASRGDFAGAKETLKSGALNIARAPIATALDWTAGRKLAAEFLKPGQAQDYAKTADALETVNGRVRPDFQYRDQFLRAYRDAARSGSKLGKAWNATMIAMEAPTKFVMQTAMNMKLGAWHEMATDVLDKATRENWTDDTKRFELQKTYDSIENRFGQVNYENLNLSRLSKDVLQLGVRSTGWTGGTLREGLGALGDAARNEFSHRVAYAFALPMTIGTMGALYTYLHTGEAPDGKDFFYPRTGRTLPNGEVERVSFPSYMKDVYSYTTHPVTTLQNKLSPLISQAAELIQNKDYSGNKIYQEDDETNQQVTDVAKYIAKQMIPFSVRNVQQRDESGGSPASKAERTVETALGITPANKEVSRTDAENLMAKFQRDSQPVGGRTRQGQQKKDATAETRREFQNTGDKGVLREAIQEGKITPTQASGIVKEKNVPYLQRGVQHLSLDQTLKIWDVANDDEKKILRSAIEKKAKPEALAGLSQDDKDRVIKKVRSILGSQPQQAESEDLLTKVLGRLPFGPSRAQKAP